ncbi:hypothetical protein L208DRAFT_1392612 [Tricholoma matsutake]|nr:hypothetical protein L208DRAFT_1392612 [Tricholoma matsutake 945]
MSFFPSSLDGAEAESSNSPRRNLVPDSSCASNARAQPPTPHPRPMTPPASQQNQPANSPAVRRPADQPLAQQNCSNGPPPLRLLEITPALTMAPKQ